MRWHGCNTIHEHTTQLPIGHTAEVEGANVFALFLRSSHEVPDTFSLQLLSARPRRTQSSFVVRSQVFLSSARVVVVCTRRGHGYGELDHRVIGQDWVFRR